MSLTVQAQTPNYIPTNGLVAWFPFNGNANDESGNGNNGVLNGSSLVPDRLGNTDAAYFFDGIDDNIYVGVLQGISSTSSHTMSVWVNKDSDGCSNEMVLATVDNPPTDNQNLHYGFKPCVTDCQTSMCMGMDFYANSLVADNPLDTSWVCWSLVYDSVSLERSIYMNGALTEQGTASAAYEGNLDFIIGATAWQGLPLGAFFSGKLDDIAIWNRVLTAQELSSICNTEIGVGLTEFDIHRKFEIYPNPSNGTVSIQTNYPSTFKSIRIFNVLGESVYQNRLQVGKQNLSIDLSHLSGGLYSVAIISEDETVIKRVVINH